MLIKIENLVKIFSTEEVESTVLHGLSFSVSEGEFVAIMGQSGCGKSTLLNIIGLIDDPSSGSYKFNSQEVAGRNEEDLSVLRKENISFIFQSFNLIDELTVAENIELALLYRDEISDAERKKRVADVMERMDITPRAKHYPTQLSGGQQQRVAVARALVSSPKLILADEPTCNLDSERGLEVLRMLREMKETGVAVIMVTHSLEHAEYADRVIHVSDGRILSDREGVNKDLPIGKSAVKIAV